MCVCLCVCGGAQENDHDAKQCNEQTTPRTKPHQDDDQDAKQSLFFDQPNTIWWAIKNIGNEKLKKEAWALFSELTQDGKEEPWMKGTKEHRGPYGETPLHVAVLFASNDLDSDTGAKQWEMIQLMWHKYANLRTATYLKEPYKGENVLHIAIVKRLDRAVLRLFVESEQGQHLMHTPATGSFFNVPKGDEEELPCCHYGEYALSFAACTNQRDTFDYLLSMGAKMHMKTTKEKHNLLHLLVLHSEHKTKFTKRAEEEQDGEEKDQSRWCRDMYDYIQDRMEHTVPKPEDLAELQLQEWQGNQGGMRDSYQEKQDGVLNWYEVLRLDTDWQNYTPLTLCAARGSKEMFRHLFAKLMETEWEWGYVNCRKLP